MTYIFGTLAIIGAICLALSTITSIGYGLYLWAHELAFAQAAWTAFVLWMKMAIGGFIVFAIGMVGYHR